MATKKRSGYKKTGIPGLSIRFSWKELLGITALKRWFSRKTGIPTTESGIRKKLGRKLAKWLTGKYEEKTGQTLDMNSRGQIKTPKTTKTTKKTSTTKKKTTTTKKKSLLDEDLQNQELSI